MLKAGKLLRELLYPELINVTCLCHSLSRVCEEVWKIYPNVDKLIIDLKNVLVKWSRRTNLLMEETNGTLPSLPVATRCGTWIELCNYLFLNLDGVTQFAEAIEDEDSYPVIFILQSLEEETLRDNLLSIYDLDVSPKTIRSLEKRDLSVSEQKFIRSSLELRRRRWWLQQGLLNGREDSLISRHFALIVSEMNGSVKLKVAKLTRKHTFDGSEIFCSRLHQPNHTRN